jgi:hypothetical protein
MAISRRYGVIASTVILRPLDLPRAPRGAPHGITLWLVYEVTRRLFVETAGLGGLGGVHKETEGVGKGID